MFVSQQVATDQAVVVAATAQQTTDQEALTTAEAAVSTDQANLTADATALAAAQAQLTEDTAAAATVPAPTVLSVLTELEAAASADSTVGASILALIRQALNLAQAPAPTLATA